MWTIQLLGGLAAAGPQQVVSRFRTQKAAALLGYLAFHAAAPPQPRELLLEVLWPDADLDAGRHNLSNALSVLRRVLEPPGVLPGTVILADQSTVRLNPDPVQTDVAAFEEAVTQAADPALKDAERLPLLLRAAELYRGPLLPGFYEEWISLEAARLCGLFLRAVAQMVPLLLGAGRLEPALAHAQRALTEDPLNEGAAQQLMQVLCAAGAASQARRIYELLEQRLREVGDAPSQALRDYAARLRSSRSLTLPAIRATKGEGGTEEGERAKGEERHSDAAKGDTAKNAPGAPSPPRPTPLAPSAFDATSPARFAGTRAASDRPSDRLQGEGFSLLTTTRFFGREAEIAQLSAMLRAPRTRLVAITGPGGIGKTRLALESAARIVETRDADAPSAAIHVPLTEVSDPGWLFEAILRALGVLPALGREPLQQLAAVLASRTGLLLILDNFEQLVEEGALLVHRLLAEAPSVRLLVTSRQTLRIAGEREFQLAPLPATGGARDPEELVRIASTALFADRAEASLPGFQLGEKNAVAVGQLCDRLEGIPLAIELAAARMSVLSPHQILERVTASRLDFLASRRRDAESRHRTLRATLDWSYLLLPESGQRFLAQMAVFHGGWTLEAAQAVSELAREEALERLMLLRDSSLIGVVDTEEGLRFTMLETVREYAAERLEQSGEREAVQRRHATCFLELAAAASAHRHTPQQPALVRRLKREHDNFRAALTWARAAGEDELRAEPACLLMVFWKLAGYFEEAHLELEDLREKAGSLPRPIRARLLSYPWNNEGQPR